MLTGGLWILVVFYLISFYLKLIIIAFFLITYIVHLL